MSRGQQNGNEVSGLAHVQALLREMDLRYQQRFDAQQQALDAALLAQEKAVQTAMIAAEKAVTKAEVAAEKRFDGVNEFRQLVTDLVREQMPRIEAEQRLTAMAERLGEMKDLMSLSTGRSTGIQAGWGYLIAAVGLASAVVAIIIATR